MREEIPASGAHRSRKRSLWAFFVVVFAVLFTSTYQNVGELAAIFAGLNVTGSTLLTPLWIKVQKDILLAGVVAGYGIYAFLGDLRFSIYDWLFWSWVAVAILITSLGEDVAGLQVVAGLRAFYPLLLVPLLRGRLTDEHMRGCAILVAAFAGLLFLLQVFELFRMPHFQGEGFFGLNKRNPGFFLSNSTAGGFASIAFLFIYWHFPKHPLRRVFLFLVLPASLFLTASGSALLAFGFFLCVMTYTAMRQRILVVVAAPLMLALLFASLALVTKRQDFYDSPTTRLQILAEVAANSMFSPQFGAGTNSAVLMAGKAGKGMIVDSTLNSLLCNLGSVGLIAFVLATLWGMRRGAQSIMFLGWLATYSMTTIIYEIYPLNFLFSVYLAYLASNRLVARSNREAFLDREAPVGGPRISGDFTGEARGVVSPGS